MTTRALATPTERVDVIPTATVAVPAGMESIAAQLPTAGCAVVPAGPGGAWRALADGNRTVILPDVSVELGGRRYFLSAKGVGALAPLYGDSPLDVVDPDGDDPATVRDFTGEAWFGEAPFGAQGEINARLACDLTALTAGRAELHGFAICPVVAVVEVPHERVAAGAARWWYRRWRGPWLQEQRLVPSDVRLFHASDRTLGRSPDLVLEEFGVRDGPALDAFVDRYLASGIAAVTLFARTLKRVPWGVHGLDFEHVWLDKDSVVAPDGTLCFADLEGVDWALAGQDRSVEYRVREQLEHNLYELMYGLDALVRVAERRACRRATQAERRRSVANRVELALARDPFVRTERGTDHLDLVVHPAAGLADLIRFRLLDLG